jgi:anti-sigma B factor antagonist
VIENPSLTVQVTRTPDNVVVICSGRLTSSTASLLQVEVKPLIAPTVRIVLDLTDLTFMDSMGLGTIAALYVSSKRAGSQLELINLSRRVRDLLTVAHLLSLFEPCGASNAIIP